MRLVDHEEAEPGPERGQLLVAEARVVEALGRDEEEVDLVGVERAQQVVPLVGVARVHGDRAHAGAPGCGDLVAHEREERGDEERGAETLLPEEQGGDEVDGRLAPSGALHDEGSGAILHEGLDGLELAIVEVGARDADEPRQVLAGGGPEVGGRS